MAKFQSVMSSTESVWPVLVVEATAGDERALAEIRDAIDAGNRADALVAFYREFAHLTEAEIEHVRSLPTWPRRVEAVHTVLRETEEGSRTTSIRTAFGG